MPKLSTTLAEITEPTGFKPGDLVQVRRHDVGRMQSPGFRILSIKGDEAEVMPPGSQQPMTVPLSDIKPWIKGQAMQAAVRHLRSAESDRLPAAPQVDRRVVCFHVPSRQFLGHIGDQDINLRLVSDFNNAKPFSSVNAAYCSVWQHRERLGLERNTLRYIPYGEAQAMAKNLPPPEPETLTEETAEVATILEEETAPADPPAVVVGRAPDPLRDPMPIPAIPQPVQPVQVAKPMPSAPPPMPPPQAPAPLPEDEASRLERAAAALAACVREERVAFRMYEEARGNLERARADLAKAMEGCTCGSGIKS